MRAQPTPANLPGRSPIGLKATKDGGAAGVATITRISFSEDDEGPPEARISVRYGAKPKKDKKGMTIGPYPETSDLRVPASVARGLSVGMRCRIRLEPIEKGEYQAPKRERDMRGISERLGLER